MQTARLETSQRPPPPPTPLMSSWSFFPIRVNVQHLIYRNRFVELAATLQTLSSLAASQPVASSRMLPWRVDGVDTLESRGDRTVPRPRHQTHPTASADSISTLSSPQGLVWLWRDGASAAAVICIHLHSAFMERCSTFSCFCALCRAIL